MEFADGVFNGLSFFVCGILFSGFLYILSVGILVQFASDKIQRIKNSVSVVLYIFIDSAGGPDCQLVTVLFILFQLWCSPLSLILYL